MKTADIPDLAPPLSTLAHSRGQGKYFEDIAQPFPEDSAKRQEEAMLDFLNDAEHLNLSTITAGGWPITACMHFAALMSPRGYPVVYMFAQEGTRKLANIQADARVSGVVHRPEGDERPADAPYLLLQGVARTIDDPEEHALGRQGQHDKKGYEFSKFIGMENLTGIRFDVVRAIWKDPRSGSEVGCIDFSSRLPS